jgi:arabinoxylan arabinofuranohydrolase
MRPDADKHFAPRAFLASCLLALPAASRAADPFTGYLFAYFTGNDKAQEAIRFALSDDGYNYKAINRGDPVISSAAISATGGVRDPHILRGPNGQYRMVVTDMVSANGWNSNYGMVLLKSNNLVDWTSAKVNMRTAFPSFAAADRVWAPQSIWDSTANKYMVYFAMRLGGSDIDKIYWAYANDDFTALATTPKVLYTYNGKAAIDADIVLREGTYHLFFKTEGTGNGIKSATSKTLTGPYTLIDRYVQPTTSAVEGSCAFKLTNSDTWLLIYDLYMEGKYQFATSTNLLDFKVASKPYSFDFKPRHGTVIPVTAAEKYALNAKWNPSSIAPSASRPGFVQTDRKLFARGGMRVVLVDIAGKTWLDRRVDGTESVIDLSGLPAGVYSARTIGPDSWAGMVLVR